MPVPQSAGLKKCTVKLCCGTTVTNEVALLLLSKEAVITAVPTATPVTRPVSFTVAMLVLFEVHFTYFLVPGKRTLAVMGNVAPTVTVELSGETDISQLSGIFLSPNARY